MLITKYNFQSCECIYEILITCSNNVTLECGDGGHQVHVDGNLHGAAQDADQQAEHGHHHHPGHCVLPDKDVHQEHQVTGQTEEVNPVQDCKSYPPLQRDCHSA